MSTKAKYRGGIFTMFESTTHESFPIGNRVQVEDFEGAAIDANKWLYCDALDATEALDGLGNCVLTLAVTAEIEEAGIVNQGNVLNWDISKGLIFEAKVDISVLPTALAEMHIGVIGEAIVADDQIAEADDIDEHAVFVLDGSGAILIYTDDGTNEEDAVATGVTAVPGTPLIFKIDFTDDANVIFYINGAAVATGTTFMMDDIASPLVQPCIRATKSGGAGLGTMTIDYIKLWQATR